MAGHVLMTPDHPRWNEFCGLLEGPKGCRFYNVGGEIHWTCDSTIERPIARRLLKGFRVDVDASLDFFASHGGYCDCEILFNVERSVDHLKKRDLQLAARRARRKKGKRT